MKAPEIAELEKTRNKLKKLYPTKKYRHQVRDKVRGCAEKLLEDVKQLEVEIYQLNRDLYLVSSLGSKRSNRRYGQTKYSDKVLKLYEKYDRLLNHYKRKRDCEQTKDEFITAAFDIEIMKVLIAYFYRDKSQKQVEKDNFNRQVSCDMSTDAQSDVDFYSKKYVERLKPVVEDVPVKASCFGRFFLHESPAKKFDVDVTSSVELSFS